jgi:hypothetical protein
VNAPQTTNINLEHTFSVLLMKSNPNNKQELSNRVIYQQERITTRWIPPKVVYAQKTTRTPSVFVQEITTPQQTDFECGVPIFKPPFSIGLIVHGNNAVRGQFPW